jgi:GT2 family glycosyltransferase
VVLKPDTIEKLYSGLQETGADMAVPKIYFYGTNLIWAAGGKFVRYNGMTRHIGEREEDVGQYNNNYKTEYAPTCFMLIKKNVFLIVGMMDEKYFVYFDDTDFVYRAKKNNIRLIYIYNSDLEHKESTSTGARSDFYYYYIYRNRIYFVKKFNRFNVLFYYVNILYHYSIRNIKLIHNRHQWNLILKAMREGLKI